MKNNRKFGTQIAPTPIVYGEEAIQIWNEAQSKPTEKTKENGKKLVEFFNSIMKESD